MYIMLNSVSGWMYDTPREASTQFDDRPQIKASAGYCCGDKSPLRSLLTIYIYGYLNRIKAGAANFAYGVSNDL